MNISYPSLPFDTNHFVAVEYDLSSYSASPPIVTDDTSTLLPDGFDPSKEKNIFDVRGNLPSNAGH